MIKKVTPNNLHVDAKMFCKCIKSSEHVKWLCSDKDMFDMLLISVYCE